MTMKEYLKVVEDRSRTLAGAVDKSANVSSKNNKLNKVVKKRFQGSEYRTNTNSKLRSIYHKKLLNLR